MKFRRKKGSRKVARRRARRSNPTMPVILANPRRKRRRLRRRRRANPSQQMAFRFPKRRKHRRWGGVKSHQRRVNPHRRRRFRRRANPSFSLRAITGPRTLRIGHLVGIGVAGVAGIVTARIVASFYQRNLSQYVAGDEGRADPTSWRGILDEVVKVVVMELGVMLGEQVLRKMRVPSEMAQAYFYAGTAETARVAIGTAVARLSPTTDRKRWGLDGPRGIGSGGKPPGILTDDGQLLVLNEKTDEYELAGVMTAEEFAMAGVMTDRQFRSRN